ncbi:MAG: hypothetical protein QM763_21580 [Agriterribacter sp.]
MQTLHKTGPPFNNNSPYNTPIAPGHPVDPNISMTTMINNAGEPKAHLYYFPTRIYYVNGNTERRIPVNCTEPWGTCELENEPGGVPIPVGAKGAPEDDGHMIVWDTVNNISYEFWRYRYPNNTAPEGQTSWGGLVSAAGNGVDNPGGRLGAGGATGSDISRLAGIIRKEEVAAGVINHALIGPTNNSCGTYRWPALKSDGPSTRPDCIPEGARLQLDPSIDLNTVTGMRPIDRMIAKALQTYGWYNVDRGGTPSTGSSTEWYIQFEIDPNATGPDCPQVGSVYCNAGLSYDYEMLQGTLPDGSKLFQHMRVLADGPFEPPATNVSPDQTSAPPDTTNLNAGKIYPYPVPFASSITAKVPGNNNAAAVIKFKLMHIAQQ